MSRRILVYAAVCGALGVAVGAFGAHGLGGFLEQQGHDPALISRRLDQFDVGVRYHLVHAVALLGLASVSLGSAASRRWVARLWLLGIVLFSGSLYALVLTNTPLLGAITPIGGVSWIVGWSMLVWVARSRWNDADNARQI